MGAFVDLTGQSFGRLTVIESTGKDSWGSYHWRCICTCGHEKIASSNNLRRGFTTSCGCYQKEQAGGANSTHKKTRTPEWWAWGHLKQRCSNPKDSRYERYGRRGIAVCDGIKYSFEHFFTIVGPRPHGRYSIDRINNNLGYDCGQCDDCKARGAVLNLRWATDLEQGRNKEHVRKLTIDGETMTLTAWVERYKLDMLLVRRTAYAFDSRRTLESFTQAIMFLRDARKSQPE